MFKILTKDELAYSTRCLYGCIVEGTKVILADFSESRKQGDQQRGLKQELYLGGVKGANVHKLAIHIQHTYPRVIKIKLVPFNMVSTLSYPFFL